MNLSKLSNKALARYMEELRGLMQIANETNDKRVVQKVEEKYNTVIAEWQRRDQPLKFYQQDM